MRDIEKGSISRVNNLTSNTTVEEVAVGIVAVQGEKNDNDTTTTTTKDSESPPQPLSSSSSQRGSNDQSRNANDSDEEAGAHQQKSKNDARQQHAKSATSGSKHAVGYATPDEEEDEKSLVDPQQQQQQQQQQGGSNHNNHGRIQGNDENLEAQPTRLSRQPNVAVPNANNTPGAYAQGQDQQTSESFSDLRNGNHGGGSSGFGLAVAEAVEDGENPSRLMEAQEVDPQQIQNNLNRKQKEEQLWKRVGFGLLALCCVAVVTVALVPFLKSKKNTPTATTTDTSPSTAPSLVTTPAPSSAPTGALDMFLEGLPSHTLVSLESIDTPQWKAMDWLSRHPQLTEMEESRKRQLFALVTFYYGMGGPHWPRVIRDGWLQYDTDECYWFSSEFGFFSGFFGAYSRYDPTNTNPCNEEGEFQLLYLNQLQLTNHTQVAIPPELAFLTSLSILGLPQNGIRGSLDRFLPNRFYQMTNLTYVFLYANSFTGTLPSQLGLLSTLGELEIHFNSMTGVIPSELGLIRNMDNLALNLNEFSGPIPSQLGLTTAMTELYLYGNEFSGQLPSELGLMTAMTELYIGWYGYGNSLTGPIPSEMGSMTNTKELGLVDNNFAGTIPQELADLAVKGPLELLLFDGSSQLLSGLVPEDLCSIGYYSPDFSLGLSFECNSQLCGCCWCPCLGNETTLNNTDCSVPTVFTPAEDDEEWPGLFPTPINSTNAVTINVRTDDHPEETSWEWSQLQHNNNNNNTQEEDKDSSYYFWSLLESQTSFKDANAITSSTLRVVSDTLYKLSLFDIREGTCCLDGFGWFTITNSMIPSNDDSDGSVLWQATGDAFDEESSLDVYVWIDAKGIAHHVEYFEGRGYVLTNTMQSEGLEDDESLLQVVVVPDISIGNSTTSGRH